MNRLSLSIALLLSQVSILACAESLAPFYVIQSKDTVSEILHRDQFSLTYRQGGSLDQIKILNISQIKNIDLITPGQKLLLPNALVQRALLQGKINLSPEGEVTIATKENLNESVSASQRDEVTPAISDMTPSPSKDDQQELPVKKTSFSPMASRWMVGLQSGFARLDSNTNGGSGTATLLSNLTLGTAVSWQQLWSEQWESSLNLSFRSDSFQTPSTGTVANSSQTLSNYSVGVLHNFSWLGQPADFDTDIGLRSDLYLPAYTPGILTLETQSEPFLQLNLRRNFITRELWNLRGLIGLSELFGTSTSNYSVSSAQEYLLGTELHRTLNSWGLYAKCVYAWGNQSTSIISQTHREIFFGAGIEWVTRKVFE